MNVDIERLQKYLSEIKGRSRDIDSLLAIYKDSQILDQPWVMRGLKYVIIEIAEAMANTLQHILAKDRGEPVIGYIETILKAHEFAIISGHLSTKLKPFFDFRNSLIHRYWIISDQKLLSLVRENKIDFSTFIKEIEEYLKEEHGQL
jgi:uncharacterized protein YutE (UPF0331/DUF86 family)